MNKTLRSLLTISAFAAGAVLAQAQPALKLVTVDLVKSLDSYYKSEDATAKFNDAAQKAQEQFEELNKQLQTLVDEYKELVEKSKNTILAAEVRNQAEADAQRKLEEIQRRQQEAQQFRVNTQRSLQGRMKNYRDILLEEVTKVVKDLARARGATLVIDKSVPHAILGSPAVIVADDAYDITADVIKEINKDRPAAAPAATATTPAAAAPAQPATPGATQFTVPNVNEPKKP